MFSRYVSLYATLFMVIVVTPIYIIYHALSNSDRVPSRWFRLLTLATWFAWFAAFWKMGDHFPIHNPKHGVLSVETWSVNKLIHTLAPSTSVNFLAA